MNALMDRRVNPRYPYPRKLIVSDCYILPLAAFGLLAMAAAAAQAQTPLPATFEEVATGMAARYARGAYPELVHMSHDSWLERLKWISETRR